MASTLRSFTRTSLRLPTSSPLNTSRSIPRSYISARTMASTGRKFEWLVVIPDLPGTLQKRIEVRPEHFAGLKPAIESGLFKMGGAILDEVPADDEPFSLKFCGSTIVIMAENKEEIKAALNKDVYAKKGVWDVENAQMWPLKCAFRHAL
ncbi:hypothetical protein QBC46DRAFT_380368 [Diplogelasinospora grovesii]|uniref:YCII-related domain-containing protein n=1 Tax=Diplogelasinospora grovesii TaxID=303347 RepID=A0AAN6NEH1_9PEZI|nr:hypothetical protein QBC46DRAFT_380368 [Diplogelasinospora grovesii]